MQILPAYEDTVLVLVAEHRGRVVQRLRRIDAADVAHPLEMHVIEFEDERAFEGYMADPRRTALASRREACIARTEIWRVEDAT